MKLLLFLMIVAFASNAWAAIAVANAYNNVTAFPVTITSTTAGNNFYLFSDGNATPASVQFSTGGTFTKYACLPITTPTTVCFWYFENIAAGKTSITCTTCGTIFSVQAMEVSGAPSSNSIDHPTWCSSAGAVCPEPSNKLTYNPGYSNELLMYKGGCGGSATSFAGTGVTWTSNFPSGEVNAYGIISAAGSVTGGPDAGCAASVAMIVGIRAAGSTQACTADIGHFDYGAELGNSGNPTVAAQLLKTGALIAVPVWGIDGISVTSVGNGTDTASLAVAGNSNSLTGQPFIYYILSDTVSGAQTITATITGTRTHSQVAYLEIFPSQGCTFSHGVDSSVGTGTGTSITTPGITGTAGSVLYNFTTSELHVTAVNSPWTCNNYVQASETGSCFFANTVNAQAYALSASGSAQANAMTQINGAWQAIISEFKLTGDAVPATPAHMLIQ